MKRFRNCRVLFLILIVFLAVCPDPCPAQSRPQNPCERTLKDAAAISAVQGYDEALKLYGGILDNPACSAELKCEAYFGRGKIRESNKDLSGAISDFDQALRCRPQHYPFRTALADAYLKRGNLRERLGDLRGAPTDYERALQYESDLPEARAALSNIYYRSGMEKENRGDWNRAEDDYRKSLHYNPYNREASEAMSNLKEKKRHKSQQRDGLIVF